MTSFLNKCKQALRIFQSGNPWQENYSYLSTREDTLELKGASWENSIVYACISWISRAFQESDIYLKKYAGSLNDEMMKKHAVLDLLRNPNHEYDHSLLWSATLLSLNTDGNAYWYKSRSRSGRVVELWYIPHFLIEPIMVKTDKGMKKCYQYSIGGKDIYLYQEDIVHFRTGFIDPKNIHKGMSPLSTVIKEICTDNEAAIFTGSILKNMGIPGVIISPNKDEVHFSKENQQRLSEIWNRKFKGDKRGEPLVAPVPLQIETLGYSPEKLVLDKVRKLPEERIASVLGISPIVLGLGSGLEKSTYNNYKEAREAAYESNIIPTQKILCKQLDKQLLSEFIDTDDWVFSFDLSEIKCLKEDQDKLFNRVIDAYKCNLIDRSEARIALGWDKRNEDYGVYYPL